MSKRKYKLGRRIKTLDELMRQEFVIHKPKNAPREKVYHCGWFWSWTIRATYLQVKSGSLYKAERIGGAQ